MQVTCPKCGARYAVDPMAIGPAGREVQCVRCNHRWFHRALPPSAKPLSRPPRGRDYNIRPSAQNANLPALAGRPAQGRWGTWLAVAVGLILLAAILAFAYRGEIRARLPPEWQSLLTWQSLRTLLAPPAGNGASSKARLETHVPPRKVELVHGRFVVHGKVVDNGSTVLPVRPTTCPPWSDEPDNA